MCPTFEPNAQPQPQGAVPLYQGVTGLFTTGLHGEKPSYIALPASAHAKREAALEKARALVRHYESVEGSPRDLDVGVLVNSVDELKDALKEIDA